MPELRISKKPKVSRAASATIDQSLIHNVFPAETLGETTLRRKPRSRSARPPPFSVFAPVVAEPDQETCCGHKDTDEEHKEVCVEIFQLEDSSLVV